MDPNRYRDLGEDLKRIVSDAVGSQNYDNLSENISKMVSGALSAAGKEIRKTGESLKNSFSANNAASAFPYPVNKKALPSGYGMPSLILGSAGTAVFALLALLSLIADYFLPSTALTVAFALLAALCLIFAVKGYRACKLKKHFKRYLALMSTEKYYLIDDVAASYPLDRKTAAKELAGLIKLGAFPQGHIDDEKKYFIGDNETYQYYTRTRETERQIMSDPQTAKKLEQTRASIEKGRQYIGSIRHANDIILDKEMSDKLDTTELILKNIFDRLEKRPELVPAARKLIEYYLPITEKLLNAYIELDRQKIGSDNIDNSKLEIEKSIDSVNTAFYNLYNSLFTDDKIDIVSDISVLQAMFAQEGLNNSDFRKGKDDPNGN